MHVHVLGIAGTFMAGLARLALELGHRVSGSDAAIYPPMSTQLATLGIPVADDYRASALEPRPDLVVIGNALGRGNPALEYVLSNDLPYVTGPEWLRREVLPGRHVIAVAGTHGKTTVSALVAWMLEHAGQAPGFLVGGMMENFALSARLGTGAPFVIEADEYDTAFCDKRAKFVHYRPRTLVINNLEFDHADIYPDLAAIQRQFHHLIRTLPREACVLRPHSGPAIDALLALGCWSQVRSFGASAEADTQVLWDAARPGEIALRTKEGPTAIGVTPLAGLHNAFNVAAAAAAAARAGVGPTQALAALAEFRNVKRRLELRGERGGVRVYDDFAHHPTAIAATIAALRDAGTAVRIIAVTEPRSNTMRLGVHRDELASALRGADRVAILDPGDLPWDLAAATAGLDSCRLYRDSAVLLADLVQEARPGDAFLLMSNGAFANLHERLLAALPPGA